MHRDPGWRNNQSSKRDVDQPQCSSRVHHFARMGKDETRLENQNYCRSDDSYGLEHGGSRVLYRVHS